MKFVDICDDIEILKALDKMNYNTPTNVQKEIIPLLSKNTNLVVKSRTGSGKTAAFAIPILENINVNNKAPEVLVLTPTRELAIQVEEEFSLIGKYKLAKCVCLYGQQPIRTQTAKLGQRVNVIVATPGRLLDHISRGNLTLDNIKYLVLDEADEMLKMGFIDSVDEIVSLIPKKAVITLFSATMPYEIKQLASKYIYNHELVEIKDTQNQLEQIEQEYYVVRYTKEQLLESILIIEKPKRCIIFANTHDTVEKVFDIVNELTNDKATYIHGGLDQKDRLAVIESFKKGEYRYLIATDVLSRGIHIDEISHVINYELPYEDEVYVHRIGRTGRSTLKGKAISITTEKKRSKIKYLEKLTNTKITEMGEPKPTSLGKHKDKFEKDLNKTIKVKESKDKVINKDITTIRINGGKDKKIRAFDILGTLNSIDGIENEDIGIIEINKTCSFVEIFNNKGTLVYNGLQGKTIKGKKVSSKITVNK